MNKAFLGHIFAFIALLGVVSCNSSDDPQVTPEIEWGDVQVISFNLQRNDSVLANLDTVFFAIDLNNARIYNPDSLPIGTKINKLQIDVSYATVSQAQIKWRTAEGVDSVKDYVAANNDTIDFSNGPVTLMLTSLDQKVTRDYQISVNVHRMAPDSLSWGDAPYATLPGGGEGIKASRTLRDADDDRAVCFELSQGGELTSYRSLDQEMNFGAAQAMGRVPEGFDIATLTLLDGKVYAVAAGQLYCYEEPGSWSSMSAPMSWIYGVYDGRILGARTLADGTWVGCSWPATDEAPLASSMPVKATSNMMVYTTEWAPEPMAILMGGRKADGSLTGSVWAYDGSTWAEISGGVPAAEGISLVPYFTFRTNAAYIVTERTALFALCGRTEADTCQTQLYVSYDRGMHWALGSVIHQMPEQIAPRYGASALVFDRTNHLESRVTRPITEWDTPYIYLFGGYAPDGTLYNQVWRGVINRLTFNPLY